ncbi:MAG TPA: hypothetical protein QGI72_01715 [Poseidonia sp.]|nr:hypothetical protein [Poseidonia sp.]
MVTWADVDSAIESERQRRIKHVDSMTMTTALLILGCAMWIAWPTLTDLFSDKGVVLSGFGAPMLLLFWGIILQDLALDDPAARSRVGASTSVSWPILMVLGALGLEATLSAATLGSCLILIVGWFCRNQSRSLLRGGFDVLRFRSILTAIGCASAIVLLFSQPIDYNQILSYIAPLVVIFSLVETLRSWVVGDDQKALRKTFKKRLDLLELRLLELKAQGAAVDQAASLLTTAREEGHLDPEYGMRLLDESEEDMERSLSLADDVEVIRKDALAAVSEASDIAPTAKRPKNAFDMGEREVTLGSLREGEQLFREAKKRASEVIEWWGQAEDAITEGSRILDGKKGDGIQRLHEMLNEAKSLLASEKPREAFEYASVIPSQLQADGDAQDRALVSLKEANRQLSQADGLDTVELKSRLKQAEDAIDEGHASQAIGLADGVVRTIEKERAAMDDVLRALKQRKKLVERYKGRDDEAEWALALEEIDQAAQAKSWSHAGMLLERMTAGLDKEGKASDDALELYDFVIDEWRILRNQCEAASISIEDDDRRECEQEIALAEEMLGVSRIEECLNHLSKADAAMERLRRRI